MNESPTSLANGLDHEQCYQIISAKDRRFDGAFFTAVTSTGIYCRPICPARTPKSSNVQFYDSAHAAHHAGFRPCLRCHPEAAPGSPQWQAAAGSAEAIVAAAQRLIEAGFLNEHSVAELAATQSITERHLRRLFSEQTGMSPSTVAHNQRLLLAKQLLDQTDLPMTQIAFAAGFNSLRRFNSAIQNTWQGSPTVVRARQRSRQPSAFFELQLSYRPPYDWPQVLDFLRMRAIPEVEHVTDDSYIRSVRLNDAVGLIQVRQVSKKHALSVRISCELSPHCSELVSRLRRLFDLDAQPQQINQCLSQDSLLEALVADKPGTRVPGAWDGFEVMVRAVVGQQVSVAAAKTLVTRIVHRFGETLADELISDAPGWPRRTFPEASSFIAANMDGMGLTGRRINTLQHLSAEVQNGHIQLQYGSSLDSYVAALTALPGIGDWTAQYIAMRALHHPDAFPAGDLVLRQTLVEGEVATEKAMREAATDWRPWRAYSVMHLWRLANQRRAATKTRK